MVKAMPLAARAEPKKGTKAARREGRIVVVGEPAPGGRSRTEREGGGERGREIDDSRGYIVST